MATVEQIINLAKKQVGYREEGVNYTKYGKAYGLNPAPWCQEFVWWLGYKVGLRDNIDQPRTASCPRALLWFKDKGRLFKSPKVGDFIYFKWTNNTETEASHVGIVTAVKDGRVYTIEGNAGSASDRVVEKSYSLKYPCIVGYGRLPLERNEKGECDVTLRVLEEGMTGNDVKQVQTMLYYGGFKGTMGKPDGIFGPRTLASVKKFQKSIGFVETGKVGEKTWAKLLEA